MRRAGTDDHRGAIRDALTVDHIAANAVLVLAGGTFGQRSPAIGRSTCMLPLTGVDAGRGSVSAGIVAGHRIYQAQLGPVRQQAVQEATERDV